MIKTVILSLFLFSSLFGATKEEIVCLVKHDLLEKYKIDSVSVEIYSPQKQLDTFKDKEILAVTKTTYGYKPFQKYKLICDGFSKKITFKVAFYKEITVAKTSLQKDNVITESDVDYKLVNISELKNFVEHKNDVIGKMAKRVFNEKEPFQKASLKEVPLVRKDEAVQVVVKNSSVQLSFDTIAISSGYEGERVYFRNPFSGELQLGTVVAYNLIKL